MFWSGPMIEDDLLAWIEENFDWVLDHRAPHGGILRN